MFDSDDVEVCVDIDVDDVPDSVNFDVEAGDKTDDDGEKWLFVFSDDDGEAGVLRQEVSEESEGERISG